MNKFLLGILQVVSYLLDNLRILEGWKGVCTRLFADCQKACILVPTQMMTHLRTYATILSTRPCKKYFSHHKFSYLLFSNPTHKTKTANRWETSNSKPPRPIKLCSQQPPAGVKVCYAFSKPPQLFKKCILPSQIDMFWLFFIQCSGPHTEPQWNSFINYGHHF